jgi:hypothetical protein
MPAPLSSALEAVPTHRLGNTTLTDEVDVAPIRSQAAVVRMLLDHLDRLVPQSGATYATRDQLIEELTRLGCRIFETTGALARAGDAQDIDPGQSGVHTIPAMTRGV